MGRRVLEATVLGLAALTIAGGAMAQDTKTLKGEVVDPATYLKDGRHGRELEEQTYEAVDGGQTLALLENDTNTVYMFLAEEPGEDPNELAYNYVNQQVTVTGTVYQRGSLQGVVATSIGPVAPAENTQVLPVTPSSSAPPSASPGHPAAPQ